MEDPQLIERLAAAASADELFAAVIELGRSHGIELTARELREIAQANRRAWLERWLVP